MHRWGYLQSCDLDLQLDFELWVSYSHALWCLKASWLKHLSDDSGRGHVILIVSGARSSFRGNFKTIRLLIKLISWLGEP